MVSFAVATFEGWTQAPAHDEACVTDVVTGRCESPLNGQRRLGERSRLGDGCRARYSSGLPRPTPCPASSTSPLRRSCHEGRRDVECAPASKPRTIIEWVDAGRYALTTSLAPTQAPQPHLPVVLADQSSIRKQGDTTSDGSDLCRPTTCCVTRCRLDASLPNAYRRPPAGRVQDRPFIRSSDCALVLDTGQDLTGPR